MPFKPSFDPEKGLVKVLVRLSYCNILRKTASIEGGEAKYRTNGLIYKTTPEGKATKVLLDKAVAALVKKEWPGKDPEKLLKTFDSKRLPVFDGDENVNDEGDVKQHFEDAFYIKLTNARKPKLKARNGEDADEDERDEMFVSGHWAVAYFHFYAVKDKKKGGNGIFATIEALQFYKKDETFGGGGIDDDEIEDLGDEDDEAAPAKPSASGKPKSKSSSIDDDDDI